MHDLVSCLLHIPDNQSSRQVLLVGWVVTTIYFLICYTAPCRKLPSGQVHC